MTTSLWPFNFPSFFSTVTPGQLPTNWLEPVRALNNVVFQQFGLPANAIFTDIFFSFSSNSKLTNVFKTKLKFISAYFKMLKLT